MLSSWNCYADFPILRLLDFIMSLFDEHCKVLFAKAFQLHVAVISRMFPQAICANDPPT